MLPEYVARDYISEGKLAKIDVEDLEIGMNSYYMYSRNRWINPAMREFIKIIAP